MSTLKEGTFDGVVLVTESLDKLDATLNFLKQPLDALKQVGTLDPVLILFRSRIQ